MTAEHTVPTTRYEGVRFAHQPGAEYCLEVHGGIVVSALAGPALPQSTPLSDSAVPVRVIRAPGVTLTRGFVDIHSHGAAGHSYDAASQEGIAEALALHRKHGTTATVLSLVSAPVTTLARRLRQLRPIVSRRHDILGVHLEGPFLSSRYSGAHDPQALSAPTAGAVDALLEAGEGVLRQVTLAPELPGASEAIDRFTEAGILVAVGHTAADFDIAAAAFDRGASLLTHAFNAMPGLGHRHPGPVGAALSRDHVALEVIADGAHLHPAVVKTVFAAAAERTVLVTDSMAATGLGDGSYHLGGMSVEVSGGTPLLSKSNTLAGSTLTLDRAVDVSINAGVPPAHALAAATVNPARLLGTPETLLTPESVVGAGVGEILALDESGQSFIL